MLKFVYDVDSWICFIYHHREINYLCLITAKFWLYIFTWVGIIPWTGANSPELLRIIIRVGPMLALSSCGIFLKKWSLSFLVEATVLPAAHSSVLNVRMGFEPNKTLTIWSEGHWATRHRCMRLVANVVASSESTISSQWADTHFLWADQFRFADFFPPPSIHGCTQMLSAHPREHDCLLSVLHLFWRKKFNAFLHKKISAGSKKSFNLVSNFYTLNCYNCLVRFFAGTGIAIFVCGRLPRT